MQICRALLKHGYSNFSLTILEYCEPDKCLIREKHYWDLFKPEYNIAQDPTAPMYGRNHSEESKTKISNAMTGKTLTDDTKTKISDSLTGEKNPMFGKTGENHHNYGQPRAEGAGRPSQQIEVTDIKNNITTSYDSIHEAARILNLPNSQAISNYIKNNKKKPYKGQYTFKKL
jgi:group I intron endonuclease